MGVRKKQIKAVPRREQVLVALVLQPDPLIRQQALARGWRLVNLLYSSLPAGVVPHGALVTQLPDSETVLGLRETGIPVVRLGSLPHPDDDKVPVVLPDHTAEGALAAEHFFERGFRDVGYFGRDPWSDGKERFEGFREQAQVRGIACHLYQCKQELGGESPEAKRERKRHKFVTWLREVPKPLGLLSAGDCIAAEYCNWITDAGLNVPGDIAVLSTGGRPDICETNMPTISSLDLDSEGRIRAACDLLARMMDDEKAPKGPIMIPPRGVIERESTNILPVEDGEVAAALRYMWDHLDKDLSVETIADELDMSSRQLARRFRKTLKRTVTEELRRKRLEKAKELLRATRMPVADIGPMVGFHSTAYLHRIFKRAFDMTPAQYRRAQS